MSNESHITVVVNGALGRMGQTVMSAVDADPALQLVAGIDSAASGATVSAPGTGEVPLAADAASSIAAKSPQVIVDFSNATGAMDVARAALPAGVLNLQLLWLASQKHEYYLKHYQTHR